jgi:hypothetical protein
VDEQERAAFRAFVRDNHPDRGGDPAVFVAGLARFRAGPEHGSPAPSASGADGTGDAYSDPEDPRWDAPIEILTPLPAPVRVAVALIRTIRWHRQRRVQ